MPSPAAADRLIDQMAENDHRAGLSTGERVLAFAELAQAGMSRAQIAKATATRSAQVKAALTASTNPLAVTTSQKYTYLTLDQAAVLSEFDDEETITALAIAARTGQFDHAAQIARDKRAEQQARRDITGAITAAEMTLIDAPDHYDGRARALHHLLDADRAEITPEAHEQCPGHAAYVREDYRYVQRTAEPDAEEIEDDDLEEDEDHQEQGEQGSRWSPRQRVSTYAIGYACTDFAAHGHTERYATKPARRLVSQMSAAEHAAHTAENRRIKDNNKAWASATTVRRTWLTTFAARKTSPPGAACFVAATLAAPLGLLARAGSSGHTLAHELLGAPRTPGRAGEQMLVDERTTPARATHVALVLALAAHEEATSAQTWRTVDPAIAGYLAYLAAAGYALADVERLAAGLDTEPTEPAGDPA